MSEVTTNAPTRLPTLNRTQSTGLAVGLVVFVGTLVLELPGIEPAAQRMLAIFLLAIVLWITEAIPLVATSLVVILLQVLLLSDQALVPLDESVVSASEVFATLADPVIILFIGGFLIADGAAKYDVDRNLAALLLRPFAAGGARRTVLGLMLITALLSMFVSNTATTATMFAVLLPVLAGLPAGTARTGLALSIPVAANIGGIGTPVGTPPNAIALGQLSNQGISISFLDWMLLAVPLMLLLLFGSWWLLTRRFIPADTPLEIDMTARFNRTPPAMLFSAVAAVTVVLWLTEPLHGMASSTVGFIPVVLLLATGVLGAKDLQGLQWHVLWLVAGGIALGGGIGASGMDVWLLELVDWEALPATGLLALLVLAGLAMSTVISSSAASNLLIPLALSLAIGLSMNAALVAVLVALACGLAMSLPISTPPNAIAYATGEVPQSAMIFTGLVIAAVAFALLSFVMPTWWTWLGLL
ncbi:MAG: DASS family sodium-coupled anion symporter [Nitriliruptoraceae bacterium]